MMKASEFTKKLTCIANDYATLYVYGAIGGHLRSDNVHRYIEKYTYNQTKDRKDKINAHLDLGIFGFDCICLIKSVLWGWNGDLDASYGGAVYKSNNVPDVSADGMIKLCTEISTDFTELSLGEYLWLKGHCGVYIGNGLAVECTPKWRDGVQITRVSGMDTLPEYERIYTNVRKWTKHGKLPYIDYSEPPPEPEKIIPEAPPNTAPEIIPEIIDEPSASTKNSAAENTENIFLAILNLIGKIIRLFFKN